MTRSARIANIRQRVQRHINDLMKIGFLRLKSKVKAERNETLTPLYDATAEGYLISSLINSESTRSTDIIDLISSISKTNDSVQLNFVVKFFKECQIAGSFKRVVSHFTDYVLPNLNTRYAKDLLLTFIGNRHIVNWLLLDNKSFHWSLSLWMILTKNCYYSKLRLRLKIIMMKTI